MSIIQEALKKAGNSDVKPEVKPDEKPVQPVSPPEEKMPVSPPELRKSVEGKKSAESRYVYYAITGFLLVLLVGIILIVSRSSQPAARPLPVKRPEPAILPKIERREEPARSPRKKESIGGFVLNGIMQLIDGPRAIINDIIVGEGETVNGARVEKIKKDSVLLNYNDSEVALNIDQRR